MFERFKEMRTAGVRWWFGFKVTSQVIENPTNEHLPAADVRE
jgi:hypothetical protein